MKKALLSGLLLVSAFAVAACAALPGRSAAPPPPRPVTTTRTPAAPATRPTPPDVFATATVGADGVPVFVQTEVDRFAGKHVKLKPVNGPTFAGAPNIIKQWSDEDSSEYTFNGRGAFVSFFPGPPGPVSRPGNSPLSDAQLLAKARDYVRLHFDDRQASWPGTVKRRVEGIDEKGRKHYEITVELRERVGEIPSPNYISLNIDLTGRATSFIRDDGPVSVASTTPRISKEQAVDLAAKAARFQKAKATSADLIVQRDPQGVTRLVWRLEIDDATPAPKGAVRLGGHAWVTIDAMTGDALSSPTWSK